MSFLKVLVEEGLNFIWRQANCTFTSKLGKQHYGY